MFNKHQPIVKGSAINKNNKKKPSLNVTSESGYNSHIREENKRSFLADHYSKTNDNSFDRPMLNNTNPNLNYKIGQKPHPTTQANTITHSDKGIPNQVFQKPGAMTGKVSIANSKMPSPRQAPKPHINKPRFNSEAPSPAPSDFADTSSKRGSSQISKDKPNYNGKQVNFQNE